ncbi:uncharacterized protein RCO7_14147 [Rhynchosporium graminicola]|uniref:Uncharacterized protein n=1 Tax=Rhynchosporium graminicola TaxID=2792576 RepID=A0A1E1JTK0_9HELO|nr:uncharacterized protein RCO7_14147 [Rhynchosporium commune]
MKLFRAFKVEVRSGFSSVKEYLTAGEEDLLNLRNDIIAGHQEANGIDEVNTELEKMGERVKYLENAIPSPVSSIAATGRQLRSTSHK